MWLSSRALARIYKAKGPSAELRKRIWKLSLFFLSPSIHLDRPLPRCAVRVKWAERVDNDLCTTKCQERTAIAMEQSASSTHTRQNWGWQRRCDSTWRGVWKEAEAILPHQLGHLGNYPQPKFICLQSVVTVTFTSPDECPPHVANCAIYITNTRPVSKTYSPYPHLANLKPCALKAGLSSVCPCCARLAQPWT